CEGWAGPGFWKNIRTLPPMSPAARRGRPSSAPSMRSWRCSPPHRPAIRPSDDAVFLQERLFVAGDPAEDLRVAVKHLHEVVDVEIDCDIRPVLARIGRRPCDMGDAMMFVHRRNADIADPHLLGP